MRTVCAHFKLMHLTYRMLSTNRVKVAPRCRFVSSRIYTHPYWRFGKFTCMPYLWTYRLRVILFRFNNCIQRECGNKTQVLPPLQLWTVMEWMFDPFLELGSAALLIQLVLSLVALTALVHLICFPLSNSWFTNLCMCQDFEVSKIPH